MVSNTISDAWGIPAPSLVSAAVQAKFVNPVTQHDVLVAVAQIYLTCICRVEFGFGSGGTCCVWAVGMLIKSHGVSFRKWLEKAEILQVALPGAILG